MHSNSYGAYTTIKGVLELLSTTGTDFHGKKNSH